MRWFLSLSVLILGLGSGIVGCDSFASREAEIQATTRATTRSTDFGARATTVTPATRLR